MLSIVFIIIKGILIVVGALVVVFLLLDWIFSRKPPLDDRCIAYNPAYIGHDKNYKCKCKCVCTCGCGRKPHGHTKTKCECNAQCCCNVCEEELIYVTMDPKHHRYAYCEYYNRYYTFKPTGLRLRGYQVVELIQEVPAGLPQCDFLRRVFGEKRADI